VEKLPVIAIIGGAKVDDNFFNSIGPIGTRDIPYEAKCAERVKKYFGNRFSKFKKRI
jgi:hypothetical protein